MIPLASIVARFAAAIALPVLAWLIGALLVHLALPTPETPPEGFPLAAFVLRALPMLVAIALCGVIAEDRAPYMGFVNLLTTAWVALFVVNLLGALAATPESEDGQAALMTAVVLSAAAALPGTALATFLWLRRRKSVYQGIQH